MVDYHALIIDDDSNNSDILKELCGAESIMCTIIQDSRKVKTLITEIDPPDMIFLDLEMPYVNGYQVLDILKAQPGWETVPVIACTVHLSEVKILKSKAFHGFLSKPLNIEAFPEQAHRILNGESVWDVGRFD